MRIGCAVLLGIASCSQPETVGEIEAASVSVCANGPTAKGVDVSAEAVDWQAFADGGWDFAIAKASEGVTFVESQFAANWSGMKAAGVVRGAYCFFHSRPDDPVAEADFFVDTVNQAGGFEPGDFAALDLEVLDNNLAEAVAADALAWLQRVKDDTGITPIIYTSPRVFDTLLHSPAGFAGYPLWDVTWNGGPPKCPNIPASWSGWAFWQYAGDSITAPGLPGSRNDGDVFNGTRDDLIRFGKSLAGIPVADAGPATVDAGAGRSADAPVTPGDAGRRDSADAGRPRAADAGVSHRDAGLHSPAVGSGDVTGGCNVSATGDRPRPHIVELVLLVAWLCRRRRAPARPRPAM
jgi:lysozyme